MENKRKGRMARYTPEDEAKIVGYLVKTKLTYQALSELAIAAYIQANPK